MFKLTLLALPFLADATSFASCTADCTGLGYSKPNDPSSKKIQFDLSALKGRSFQTLGKNTAETYYFTVCGINAAQTCPDDKSPTYPVKSGSAVVKTTSDVLGEDCYVLGRYRYGADDCEWDRYITTPSTNQPQVKVKVTEGSTVNCPLLPESKYHRSREFQTTFICPSEEANRNKLYPTNWVASQTENLCDGYELTMETCAACDTPCVAIAATDCKADSEGCLSMWSYDGSCTDSVDCDNMGDGKDLNKNVRLKETIALGQCKHDVGERYRKVTCAFHTCYVNYYLDAECSTKDQHSTVDELTCDRHHVNDVEPYLENYHPQNSAASMKYYCQ